MSGVLFLLTAFLGFLMVSSELPQLDVGGFSWAENQAFDSQGNLFVSDTTQGIIYRIFLDRNYNTYNRTSHTTGFASVNGIVYDEEDSVLYACVTPKGGSPAMASVDPVHENSWKSIASMPLMGNGLAWDGEFLYSTNEGNFIPGNGVIMRTNPSAGITSYAVKNLDSADGCQILNFYYLYISEVLTATFRVFDIGGSVIKEICNFVAPPGVQSIDDFTFSADGSYIYGADYRNGTLVKIENQCAHVSSVGKKQTFATNDVDYIMQNLVNPTSVYFPPSGSTFFNTSSVYVSEGGALISSIKNRKVLESPPVI
eukprot:CAMPEP_0201481922 /NCGR_PEP_ID=MMETSP0151_2-20130828/6179_1 /ASSEMBLY_ACC=CAM_ASM_000257 /TAXON_ID=200890 /ORGANISM="Paramoeba atlantica, Strain 621/1 / CCAP 1560/9" /LENGTH=312 /DNA_ID=CAMNT_0047864335 /DNA_START=81 /DNA_END=1019 /DNA_ORIENTATION=+